ncbi:glyoxylase-like metal-dependent hydrolase (beta-lactamase superfamily II) [Marmoricola sp. OAE513]|uniref:MBL fold metallo-hydrolase n=1 Tax=Marmoricola sp. OAE513 TaxID=2817894 RepID=UPI001AEA9420
MTSLIRHLNCASMAPRAPFGLTPDRMVCHCLLIEGPDGLTLVDSGFGTEDLAQKRMGKAFIALMGASLDPGETAVAQVRALGYAPEDVKDVVLTHLDLDHAGGIGDFPTARVHVFADELDAARKRASAKEKNRYIEAQWAHGPSWVVHDVDAGGESWFGFESVTRVSEDLLLVPTRGHTRGHVAVAVRRPSGGWFLHAGDSYFNHGEKQTPPTCPSGLSIFQSAVQMDKKARLANQDRIRSLHADHGNEVTIFCAHDALEFDALEGVTD